MARIFDVIEYANEMRHCRDRARESESAPAQAVESRPHLR